MKMIFLFIVLGLGLISCRKNDAEPQQIDQILNIYIKDSLHRDLLNPKHPQPISSVSLSDLGGRYSNTNLSGFRTLVDADSLYFIQYISGATRNIMDSINPELKYYQSDIALTYQQKINDSTHITTVDTLQIKYLWTPTLFQIKNIWLNQALIFSKQNDAPNTVEILK